MTRMKVAVLAAVGVLLGVGGCAGPKEAMSDISGAVPGLEQNWTGIVTEVNPDRNAIAVSVADATEEKAAWFAISPQTVMVRDGERVSLGELQEGTPVKVAFEPAPGPERTFRVEVLTGMEAEKVLQQAGQQTGQQNRPE